MITETIKGWFLIVCWLLAVGGAMLGAIAYNVMTPIMAIIVGTMIWLLALAGVMYRYFPRALGLAKDRTARLIQSRTQLRKVHFPNQ